MTETLNFDHLLSGGAKLHGFQTVGVAYAALARRCFIADQMGLGKTLQALATLEATQSFPAVVVCPASLKGNWAKEIRRFTSRSVEVVSGRRGPLAGAEIVVVNYDILAGRVDQLIGLAPQALICDESHYAKETTAQRTKAALKLAEAVPEDGVVLCLTGTPVLNRPVELISQLEILGRLAEIAPRPRGGKTGRRDYEFSFKFAYCGAEHNGHGWDFKGASNLTELNDKMRSACYVRRQRDEVLDLEKTTRTDVVISLNGALDDYREAEADFIGWLYDTKGASAARSALRAEAIAKLGQLRRLVGRAKIAATIEWVENFQASFPGKSLVIFAHHVEVQKALAEHFACPTILGGQDTASIEAGKTTFQAGEAKVIVCSLTAAREGHTLTAASDVLFVELPWHAGAYDQAADRCNRIGQTEAVTAWNLLVEDTVDERLASIIEAKRAIFTAAAEGGEPAQVEESTVNELIDSYRKA